MDTQTDAAALAEAGEDDAKPTLYFTLSLYADEDHMRHAFKDDLDKLRDPASQIRFQEKYENSIELRRAIEPLLNDITDREREESVEDFLLWTPPRYERTRPDVEARPIAQDARGEWITVSCPARIEWTTEGRTWVADIGAQSHKIHVRSFWYVHANGAVSHHTSFRMQYEHQAKDFFFMSMLQKVCAPKEFVNKKNRTDTYHCIEHDTGLFPLDSIMVSTENESPITFWNYVSRRFNKHAGDLFRNGKVGINDKQELNYFAKLIGQDKFIEVPHLRMPRARCLFLFDDEIFFKAISRRNTGEGAKQWKERYEDLGQSLSSKLSADRTKPVSIDNALIEQVTAWPEVLQYCFLSGFCQNIIDFLNQDAPEILDSLDPIYPATPEQEIENFYFRFANPRAMVQFVHESRSLDVGRNFIGTCPYAFLIHVAALHNEFFTRSFERKVTSLENATDKSNAGENYRSAVERFYDFRGTTLRNYHRYRYENVFRYDTERDCFAALERVRGTHRKVAYLENAVESLAKMADDRESRQRSEGGERINVLLVIIGVFAILPAFFEIRKFFVPEQSTAGQGHAKSSIGDLFAVPQDTGEWFTLVLTVASVGLLTFALYHVVKILGIKYRWWKSIRGALGHTYAGASRELDLAGLQHPNASMRQGHAEDG